MRFQRRVLRILIFALFTSFIIFNKMFLFPKKKHERNPFFQEIGLFKIRKYFISKRTKGISLDNIIEKLRNIGNARKVFMKMVKFL